MSAPMLTMPIVVEFHEARRQFMTAYFTLLWRRTGGNISQMARLSGIGRAHVRRYLRDLEITPGPRACVSPESREHVAAALPAPIEMTAF